MVLLLIFLCFPSIVLSDTTGVFGPESLALDLKGGGPYTGASDGRILKYQGPNLGFKDFAYTSPNRSKAICDGASDTNIPKATCGRPLGIEFYNGTGDLYIADAYFGLLLGGPNGGPATQHATGAKGVPFQFLDGLDVDQGTGVIYFTEASAKYQISEIALLIALGDNSGSLYKYDPTTKEVTVLLTGLAEPGGVAVSNDGTFVLVSEFLANRILRVWLKGPKANTSEIFLELQGAPDNIKRNSKGEFWVAVNNLYGVLNDIRRLRKGLLSPSLPSLLPQGIGFNEEAAIPQVVSLGDEYALEEVSEVHEFNGSLYLGSLFASYAAIVRP
ncbi:Strictosidine synthase 1 [Morella rubra]|uniref:Strictosidine synthase 1 n=1 Tax=Morella rubra TaxID=262757 RepID=A0A6A1W1A7_9ROSI|nr:Strictosidine synthase 1 [Morella rubra]KAB1218875.1 Strictosidine synthase 1 [Morella rubra]KAB1218908.1 Strictosidine synthase 1 [Morella rubra]